MHKRKAQSRDDALYALFSASDSDEEEEQLRSRKRRAGEGDFLSKPVRFVSAGTAEEVEKVSVDDQKPSAAGLGIERDDGFVERREHERPEKEKEKAKAYSSKSRASTLAPEFEKYTRAIGSKLLEKMGYKGGGLGKDGRGIAAPLVAKLRPKSMGMGFDGYVENAATDQVDKLKEVKPKEKAWLKKYHRRHKYSKTAAEDLFSEKDEQITQLTILDLRFPQVRVLTDLKHVSAHHSEDELPMPELQHNIRLIMDFVEVDIQKYNKNLQYAKESAMFLENERVCLQTEADQQKHQIESLEKILSILGDVQADAKSLQLEALAAIFRNLQQKYPEEYKLHNLSVVALSFALPLMVRVFQGWEPLHQPLHGKHILGLWHNLFQGDEPPDYSDFPQAADMSSPYVELVMEAVFPHIHFTAINTWEPRNPQPMLKFLEVWEKLLPSSVFQFILEHLVLSKLAAAVDAWDPRAETVAIHVWLHPWLPLLGKRMEPLYYPICSKLTDALRAWHPSDGSAYALLSPWQKVFDPQIWEQLLVRSIIPKLMGALQELVITPREKPSHQFKWVAAWFKAVPIAHLAVLLEAGFFPKWHQVLHLWLSSSPDLGEVAEWYENWKSFFKDELLVVANERIMSQLLVALEMMNQAAESMPIVHPRSNKNTSHEKKRFETRQLAYAQQQQDTSCGAEASLKEVVAYFAEQNDVQFLPKAGRSFEGHQVYGFGSTSVCIDNAKQQISCQVGDKWVVVY